MTPANLYPLPCRDCGHTIEPGDGRAWQLAGRWHAIHAHGCPTPGDATPENQLHDELAAATTATDQEPSE